MPISLQTLVWVKRRNAAERHKFMTSLEALTARVLNTWKVTVVMLKEVVKVELQRL